MHHSQSKMILCRVRRNPYSPLTTRTNFRVAQRKKLRSPLSNQASSTLARQSMRGPPRKPHRTFQPSRSETTNHKRRFLLSVKLLLTPKFLPSVKLQLSKRLESRSLIFNLLFPPSLSFLKQPYLQPCQKLPKLHPLR